MTLTANQFHKYAALVTGTGRWSNKVFICAVIDQQIAATDPPDHTKAREDAKARLLELSRAGAVRLHRADLVSEMPRSMVDSSLIRDGRATFHLLETNHV